MGMGVYMALYGTYILIYDSVLFCDFACIASSGWLTTSCARETVVLSKGRIFHVKPRFFRRFVEGTVASVNVTEGKDCPGNMF